MAAAGARGGRHRDRAPGVVLPRRHAASATTSSAAGATAGTAPSTCTEAIVQSCDVFFYQLGQRLGIDTIADVVAQASGSARRPASGCEHEKAGIIPDTQWKQRRFKRPWFAGETHVGRRSGRGTSRRRRCRWRIVAATIANGGTVLPPALREARRRARRHAARGDRARGRRDGADHLAGDGGRSSRAAMRDVVMSDRRHRAARRASAPSRSAGKTGTAQAVALRGLEPARARDSRDHAWFIAFAPVRGADDRARGARRARRRRRRQVRRADRQARCWQRCFTRDAVRSRTTRPRRRCEPPSEARRRAGARRGACGGARGTRLSVRTRAHAIRPTPADALRVAAAAARDRRCAALGILTVYSATLHARRRRRRPHGDAPARLVRRRPRRHARDAQLRLPPARAARVPHLPGRAAPACSLVPLVGQVGGGSRRWMRLGPVSIQPSEFMKLAMVLVCARHFSLTPPAQARPARGGRAARC